MIGRRPHLRVGWQAATVPGIGLPICARNTICVVNTSFAVDKRPRTARIAGLFAAVGQSAAA